MSSPLGLSQSYPLVDEDALDERLNEPSTEDDAQPSTSQLHHSPPTSQEDRWLGSDPLWLPPMLFHSSEFDNISTCNNAPPVTVHGPALPSDHLHQLYDDWGGIVHHGRPGIEETEDAQPPTLAQRAREMAGL
ncbi:hypothetical protein SCP_1303090 [Sparassis crispa]|uniref:Uncharacterized protein n=1 Tax=Sparassis crispa TaxID=139825 RepID=A0A401H275_9APHY|nr:hypothetical protein SCP_1303090 [Sparassis crispa]GBE88493.1 hypothetical protein SCP_1303090 [Sparassis crispa]